MDFLIGIKKVLLNCLLLLVFISCYPITIIAQNSSFIRDDNYDFSGLHYVASGGIDINNFNLFITEDIEFRNFKLFINTNKLKVGRWWAWKYRIDFNNDGIWETDWLYDETKTLSYYYPEPTNGVSQIWSIKFEIWYCTGLADCSSYTEYSNVTIYSKPRVFRDYYNNSFVQLRDEDCTNKIPVLLVEGFDPVNEKFQQLYYYLTWNLVNTDLIPNGYEVFILNFIDGGRDLRTNANVLMYALDKIHEICPNYQIAVAGLSMGGPITRYALAKKESWGISHNVGLFVSYDAPQDGAHINPDLQDWIELQNSNEGIIGTLQANLNSVAAKQMLRYNTYDPSHSFRNDFYNDLNSLNSDGYPHSCYNGAVSNGNLIATWGYEDVGRHLMTLKINDNLIKDVPAVHLDCGTGSMITDIAMKRYGDIFAIPFFSIYYELSINFNPVYIPTYSALDLVNAQVNTLTGDITSFDRSKFDDYVVQTTPFQHHLLSTTTRSKIMDWLDLDFNVQVNYNLLEGGTTTPDNNPIQILHGLPITISPKTISLNGRQVTYQFTDWWDGNRENPRKFFTSHNASRTVNMKGISVTNTTFSEAKSGQRGFLKDNFNRYLHNVYESNGKIYYERSTDNGVNWQLMNNGVPLNSVGNAKSPSICENRNYNYLYIVYQCDDAPPPFDNGLIVTQYGLETASIAPNWQAALSSMTDFNYANDYQPVIASFYDEGVVVCNPPSTSTAGLRAFKFTTEQLWHHYNNCTEISIPSSQNSSNPSLVAGYLQNNLKYHLVFDEAKLSIKYYAWNSTSVCSSTVSVSSGTIYNLKPVISLLEDKHPIITWIGATTGYYPTRLNTRVGTLNNNIMSWGNYNSYLGLILSASNASNSVTPQRTLITWTDMYGSKWQKREGTTYNTPSALSHNGYWTQAATNEDFILPKALVFNNTSTPYYFITSTTDFTGGNSQEGSISNNGIGNNYLGKITENDTIVTFGRSGVASINDIEFVFETGDIIVGDSIVRFIEIQDTITYNSTNQLNQHTRTNNFTLSPETNFYFSNIYYVVQKSDPLNALLLTDAVNFKVELVHASTNQVVGTFDNINYNKNNLEKYASIDYEVDCSGITVGDYYLRLVTNVTGNAIYTLANLFNGSTILEKKNYNKVNFIGSEIPATYDLAQNFPNPFNPSTTIRYQIPQDGIVTLKIYDILGSEVATLVNEEKIAGKYEVNFNASVLASGVYIYKIQAGSFINSKKMILLK